MRALIARTTLEPDFGPTRNQTATGEGGAADVRPNLGGTAIEVQAATSSATASCVAGAPRLEATSKVVGLKIGDQTITVPDNGTGQEVIPVGLLGLLQVTLNAREQTGTATSNEQSLTRRASIRRVTFGSAEVQLPRRAIGFVKTPVERPKQQLLSRKLRSLWVLTSPIRHHGHSAFSPAGGPARRAVRS